jgi:hypothetical protein
VADRATTGWPTAAGWASSPVRKPCRLLSALAHVTDRAGGSGGAKRSLIWF